MATQPTPAPTLTLAELAAFQQAHQPHAYSLGDDAETLARLRRAYARKRAELAAVLELGDDATPDLLLRTVDGRQVALRLPFNEMSRVLGLLREVLDSQLQVMETDIVDHLRCMETAAESATHQANAATELRYYAPILALCAPGDAALPALPTPGSVWLARVDAAETLEEQMQQEHDLPGADYGREILWHPHFPAEYVACVSRLPLYEVAEFHEALPTWCNQRRPLDGHDYQYLADVLREELASHPTELATLRLRRALACVEQAGAQVGTLPPMPPAAAQPVPSAAALPAPELAVAA